jgi:hypothetical protein
VAWLLVGLLAWVMMLGLVVVLLIVAAPWLVWLVSWREGHREPPAVPPSKTARLAACKLVKNTMVLTPSTPYRYRVEQVLWIEKQPFGPVTANLEGPDPATGMPQQRWHQWRPEELVTAFIADVEIQEHDGDYGGLYGRYSTAAKPEQEPDSWQRMSQLTFPE